MATVHTKVGIDGIEFGIPAEEGGLITKKVSVNRKVKKKDLRGRLGGFKSIASFGKSVEVSIEGAVVGPSPGSSTFVLAAAHELDALNDDFSLGVTLYVEGITINEKSDDFKTHSVKLTGSENMG